MRRRPQSVHWLSTEKGVGAGLIMVGTGVGDAAGAGIGPADGAEIGTADGVADGAVGRGVGDGQSVPLLPSNIPLIASSAV